MPTLLRDYETRGTLDLRKVGAARYARHRDTDVLCAAYCVDDGPIELWRAGDPIPEAFVEAARDPDWLVVAFNDHFERAIERGVLAPRYGWPTVPIERHRAFRPSALAHALPASLDKVATALGLAERKDVRGHRVMLQLARPRKPRRDEDPAGGPYWRDDADKLATLYDYCRQDIATERALHARIGLLPPAEQEIW